MASILGDNISNKLGKYLGVFVDDQPRNNRAFLDLVNKVELKLSGWKAKLLSQAARLTLVKSVLQSTPIYQLSVLDFPNKYSNLLDSTSINFYWAKQVWRILDKPLSIYSQWSTAKYFNRDLEATPKKLTQPYAIWKCINKAGSLIFDNLWWQIGNGEQARARNKKCMESKNISPMQTVVMIHQQWDSITQAFCTNSQTISRSSYRVDRRTSNIPSAANVLHLFKYKNHLNAYLILGYGDIQYIVLEKKGHVQLLRNQGNDPSQVIIIQDISFLQRQRNISIAAATQGSQIVKQYALQLTTSYNTLAQNAPQDFLDVHNAARAEVGVGPMAWNETVESYAQNYAIQRIKNCEMEHSGGPYGENLAENYGNMNGSDAVKFWLTEKPNYDYASNKCVNDECLHYTQIVWRDSNQLGCARAKCNNGWMFVIVAIIHRVTLLAKDLTRKYDIETIE
ncbi:basic form of pathogenesis-related protein 1-like [Senna tora]|uniref:Basic form of pathogenesis-related protein 1-like n=1 Tax=Senna tora TaxID=362788 RepID=A0A834SSW9_9FABA|nr:basic form of pathogenesis-related protein 1-like [Senna tora]